MVGVLAERVARVTGASRGIEAAIARRLANEGARETASWDECNHIGPFEAMAEATLLLCTRPQDMLSGRAVRSLSLLEELGTAIKGLNGESL